MWFLESAPPSEPFFKSVFDHSQLLIYDSFHAPLLGNVLPQETIEVLVAAALPDAILICIDLVFPCSGVNVEGTDL